MINDERFLNTIKDLQDRVSNLEKTRQPQVINWSSINNELLQFSPGNDYFGAAKIPYGLIAVGDKLKVRLEDVFGTDMGTYYFFVTNVSGGYIYVDQTLPTSSLIVAEAWYSKLTTPVGFDIPVSYTPTITVTGSGTYSTTLYLATYQLIGPSMLLSLWFSVTTTSTGNPTQVDVTLPYPRQVAVIPGERATTSYTDSSGTYAAESLISDTQISILNLNYTGSSATFFGLFFFTAVHKT